jgi:predicted Zn-dependent peptidase
MTLAIMGNFDIEKLEEWAVEKFSDIPFGEDVE